MSKSSTSAASLTNDADARNVVGELSPGAHVAVLRLRSLGDSVLSTPAVHLLKAARPDLKIGVVSESRFREVWTGNPDVEAILEPHVRELRKFRPELCLNLHGGTRSIRLTALSGARYRAGFAHFRYSGVYNVIIPSAQEVLGVARKVHTAEHAAAAMFHLGVPQSEVTRARLFVSGRPRDVRQSEAYAILHAMASESAKTWPAPFFLEIANYLQRELSVRPIFIGGPGEDVSPFQRWQTVAGASLGEIKNLIAGASLFVGNDSGPAHMAAAFGVPVVVLFGPSDSVVWAPWKTESEVLVANGPIETIAPDAVQRALHRLGVHA